MSAFTGITQMARHAFERMAANRRRRETMRVLEQLPPQILKDIGYGEHVPHIMHAGR